MAVKNTAQVVIGGKIFTLGGYESEEYFQKVASYDFLLFSAISLFRRF